MNQILSVEMSNNRNKKPNKKANIKTVIILFCVILVIFGAVSIAVGVLSNDNDENQVAGTGTDTNTNTNTDANTTGTETGSESKIVIEVIQGVNYLDITVTSKAQIDNVIYKWNDEEETQVNANGDTTLDLEISIPVGTNTLTITAKDINGEEKSFSKEYTGTERYEPEIALSQENNTIKVTCTSEETIDYISYTLDSDEENSQEINDTTGEISFDVVGGEHSLTIKVVNVNEEVYEESHTLYIPTITVETDGTEFIITVSDTSGIATVNITFNGEEQTITVNDTEYVTRLTLQDGDNRVIVVATNENNLSLTKKIKYEKE